MPLYADATDQHVPISPTPKRIISLVPSQTELLHHLGLREEVAGITKFCVHPNEWFRTKPRIGGTKTVDLAKVESLEPDLILAAKEENVREQVDELALKYPVWVSDVRNLHDALRMIRTVGRLTGTEGAANLLSTELVAAFGVNSNSQERTQHFALKQHQTKPVRAVYLIWNDPMMTVGGDTFINDMLDHAGYENIFRHQERYPVITADDIPANNCDVLLLSSEPFRFTARHVEHFQQKFPFVKVVLVDGEAFSWYGSRLLHSPAYFRQLYTQVTANV